MSESATSPVGIVGVGALGLVIAERLLRAGQEVIGYRRGSLAAFEAAGGEPAGSVAAVAAADPILLLLPSDDALELVLAEFEGALRPGQTVVCLSTHPVEVKEAAARLVQSSGAVLLDGEVSGTPEMVRDGSGSILIAGNTKAIAAVQHTLKVIAPTVIRLSHFGDAYRAKLIANCLVGIHVLAAAEALALGTKIGLDPDELLAVLTNSAATSRMLEVRGPMMLRNTIEYGNLSGFQRFYQLLNGVLAAPGHAPGRLMEATELSIAEAIDAGLGDRDLAVLYSMFERRLAAIIDRKSAA